MSKATGPQLVERVQIDRASADPKRVEAEAKLFEADPDGYIERRFTELRDWDFPTYCAVNFIISDKLGRTVRLFLNRIQRRLWQMALDDLVAGRPIRWIIIKFRQGGVSLFVAAFFYWLCSLREGRDAVIVSQDSESVHNFSSRLRAMHDESHPLLVSPTRQNRRNVIQFANPTARGGAGNRKGAGINSNILFIPCTRQALGRSYRILHAHLSEFCFWEEVGRKKINIKDKLGGLIQAIPRAPGTAIIAESTPNGQNQAKTFWDEAVAGKNGFKAIFLPWPAMDEYRLPLRDGETLDLCGAEEIGGQSTRYGDEVREAKLVKEILKDWYPDELAKWGTEWLEQEVLARLNWRRVHIDEACGGDKNIFRREFPTVPEDGFEATSKNAFDLQSIAAMRRAVEEEGIQPKRFAYIHDPEVDDPNQKFVSDPYGPLVIYEPPQADGLYVLAGDPAQGIPNGDPSALIVLRVSGDILEEVASYNKIITPDQLAELVFYLGKLYNDCLVGIENNEKGGFAVNLKLHREMNYPHLYYRYDAYDKKAAGQPGFVTKGTNKSLLVTGLAMRIRDHEIVLRSPQLLEQLEHYVDLGDGELGGSPGFNDDLVSAATIAVHLSTKVHEHVPRNDPPPGSIGWEMKRGSRSNRRMGRRR